MLKNILADEIVTNVAVDKLFSCITGVMQLMINLSIIMKGEVIKGLRMGITGDHH